MRHKSCSHLRNRECRIVAFLLLTAVAAAAQAAPGNKSADFRISTASFSSGATIPKPYTCSGKDISPQLSWVGAPAKTAAFALIVDDPDAPSGTWTHWLIWNIPANETGLPEGVPNNPQLSNGARQGRNDFGKAGYNGPCPPPGKPHRYFFKLFALDAPLDVKAGAGRKELESAMRGHVLQQTQLMGRYGR